MWQNASRLLKNPSGLALAGAVVWLGLLAPPLRNGLESSMTLHMLVQLPLLALTASRGARHPPVQSGAGGRWRRCNRSTPAARPGGLPPASPCFWMLPRSLDAARLDLMVDALNFTVPIAFGAAARPGRAARRLRAVIHLEAIATLLRFGWGYLATEQRLCLVYLLDDQQRAGELLLWLGAAWALAVVWRPMFGSLPRPHAARH